MQQRERMKVDGYKLNGYDATYESTIFSVTETGNMLEITDTTSGITFVLNNLDKPRSAIRAWKSPSCKTKQGLFIHYGRKS